MIITAALLCSSIPLLTTLYVMEMLWRENWALYFFSNFFFRLSSNYLRLSHSEIKPQRTAFHDFRVYLREINNAFTDSTKTWASEVFQTFHNVNLHWGLFFIAVLVTAIEIQGHSNIGKTNWKFSFLGKHWWKLCFPVLIVSRSSVCFPYWSKHSEMFGTDMERDWNVGQDLDLNGRVFRLVHWVYPRLFLPGIYVCRSDCFHLFFDWNVLHWPGMGFARYTAVYH